MKKVAILVGLSLFLAQTMMGQVWGAGADDSLLLSRMTVSAQGTVRVPPDKAIVGLAVETAGESLEVVQEENRTRVRRILERLGKLGIPERQIQTASMQVTPHYPPPSPRNRRESGIPEAPRIIGYTVTHALTVEVRKLEEVGRVVDGAFQAGANRFSQITWGVEDERPARLAALKAAANKAREKAEVLAQALGVKLVRVLAVNEGPRHVIPQPRRFRAGSMSLAMEESSDVPVSPGELTIVASVNLEFEIRE